MTELNISLNVSLTLKMQTSTAADDIFRHLSQFSKKLGVRFHGNHLLADNSHEISYLFYTFEKSAKVEMVVCCKL